MKLVLLPVVAAFVSAQALASAGLETSFGLNAVEIQRTVFEGQCPGEEVLPVEAFFVSSKTQGAVGRRVLVRNISPSMNSSHIPFTDRAYEGARSEHTFLDLDTVHRTRTLSVAEGANDFQYSITEAGNVLESGTFHLNVIVTEIREQRGMECRWENECSGGPFGGPICRQVWKCACPL